MEQRTPDRTRTWIAVAFGMLAALALVCVGGAVGILAHLGFFDDDLLLVNRSGAELRDVRLFEERFGTTRPVAEFDRLANGETGTVESVRRDGNVYGVSYRDADGTWVAHDALYLDGDERGDRTLVIAGGKVAGVDVERTR